MLAWPPSPTVYEINTWPWLRDLSVRHGRPITLASVPRAELERLAAYRLDALWLMGVWERSPAGRAVALQHPGLRADYHRALPDWTPADVVGSPYAVRRYRVDPALGGDAALASLRRRLHGLGLRLILDFVPNHLALDHPWAADHPERFLHGTPDALRRDPHNYLLSSAGAEPRVLAHGRDPFFPGWTDTLQLDYRRPDTRRAMADALHDLAARCDGLRCDMAMLVTADVFGRTWGGDSDPPGAEFWPDAIARARAANPDFLLLAEVYWGLEEALQHMGFDYTYDKILYDRLLAADAPAVRAHLRTAPAYQHHLARFIENHDEPRALDAFGLARSRAAATLTLTLPGLRLIHEGQLEGRRLKLPVQLGRRRPEAGEPGLEPFYRHLLAELARPVLRRGAWSPLEPRESSSSLVAHRWALGPEHRLIVVNLSPQPARGLLCLDLSDRSERPRRLRDLFSDVEYTTAGGQIDDRGFYADLPGHGAQLLAPDPVPC